MQWALALLDRHGQDWHHELATTLRKLMDAEREASGSREQKLTAARDRFYRGDIADELERWYIAFGAFLRKRDLEAHQTFVEDPVSINYRGYTVYKCGPWTQGLTLLQVHRKQQTRCLHRKMTERPGDLPLRALQVVARC